MERIVCVNCVYPQEYKTLTGVSEMLRSSIKLQVHRLKSLLLQHLYTQTYFNIFTIDIVIDNLLKVFKIEKYYSLEHERMLDPI